MGVGERRTDTGVVEGKQGNLKSILGCREDTVEPGRMRGTLSPSGPYELFFSISVPTPFVDPSQDPD